MTENPSKPNTSDEIDKNLRLVYESVLNEELPDRFSKLLDALKSGEQDAVASSQAKGEDSTDV